MPAQLPTSVEQTLPPDPLTELTRAKELQRRSRDDLYAVLDAALIAHVGFVRDGFPVVIPMAYCRDGDTLLVHGSTGAGISRAAGAGIPMSATVTVLDGLVYEGTLFDSTLNYRSAMAFGLAVPVPDDDRERTVRLISERLMPGRWAEVPVPTRKQLAATAVLRLPLDRASVKIRSGPPSEDPTPGLWTGHVPIHLAIGAPVTQDGVDAPVSASVPGALAVFADQFGRLPA
ncbi:MAG TPA: pyridoxamine 5'-phosphate oxidase family protein [Pseudonocardia sp.]|jgi:hypothetical protein|nr:pyridoxamine 5'-phosphate oxidase family protein [Pseudonocardia sp.]